MVSAFRSAVAVLVLVASAISLSSCMYTRKVEARYPPIGEFVTVDGAAQHFVQKGEGKPVLMIHGASANAREYLITLTPHLSDEPLSLFMADRTGHGYSERVEDGKALAVQAATLAKAVEARASEPMVVVGHSFGGAVALRFALDYPDRVKALVLIAPVTHDWGDGGVTWYNQIAALPAIGHVFSQFAPLVGPDTARGSLKSLFSPAPPPEGYADRMGVDLLFRPPVFRNNARDMIDLKAQLAVQEKRYSELEIPIVVFSGSYDTVLKPKLHAAKLRRDVPEKVVLVKLDDEGHMPHHGKAELIAHTISRLARGESVQETDFEMPSGS